MGPDIDDHRFILDGVQSLRPMSSAGGPASILQFGAACKTAECVACLFCWLFEANVQACVVQD